MSAHMEGPVFAWSQIARAAVLAAVAVPALALGSCRTATPPLGTCIKPPPESTIVGEMSLKECRETCPECTWQA